MWGFLAAPGQGRTARRADLGYDFLHDFVGARFGDACPVRFVDFMLVKIDVFSGPVPSPGLSWVGG